MDQNYDTIRVVFFLANWREFLSTCYFFWLPEYAQDHLFVPQALSL